MAEQSSSSNLALFIDCTGQSEVCRRLLKGPSYRPSVSNPRL